MIYSSHVKTTCFSPVFDINRRPVYSIYAHLVRAALTTGEEELREEMISHECTQGRDRQDRYTGSFRKEMAFLKHCNITS